MNQELPKTRSDQTEHTMTVVLGIVIAAIGVVVGLCLGHSLWG